MSKELEVSKNRLKTDFEPIVLSDTTGTRLVLCPEKFPDSGLRLNFIHQRKTKDYDSEYWEKEPQFNKRTLKGGECVGLELGTEETQRLLEQLPFLAEAAELEFEFGHSMVTTLSDDEQVANKDDLEELQVFKELLENKSVIEIQNILEQIIPEVTQRLSELKIIDSRKRTLAQFQEQLTASQWQEKQWQDFFHTNQWIFGYGINFCYLEELRKEGYCGGKDDSGTGGQFVDFIMAAKMETAKFTVLVEIKTPQSGLIKDKHRNHVYSLDNEFVASISQIQHYCERWEREISITPQTVKKHSKDNVYTYRPKGILVIGHSNQFNNDEDKFATFELFRRGLHNIDVLTYDELYQRAEYVVNHTYQDSLEATLMQGVDDDSCPF